MIVFAQIAEDVAERQKDHLPLVILLVAAVACALMVQVAFVVNLSRCLRQVRDENRTTGPSSAWLLLVPFFNLFHVFDFVRGVAYSVKAEYQSRGWHTRGDDFGAQLGLVMSVFWWLAGFPLISPISLILTVLYWVRISGYRRRLEQNQSYVPHVRPSPLESEPLDSDGSFDNLG